MKTTFLIISIGLAFSLSSCSNDESTELYYKDQITTSKHHSTTKSIVEESSLIAKTSENTPIIDIDYFLSSNEPLHLSIQSILEENYSEDSNLSSNETTLRGKPFTIIKSKGLRLYRWDCKEGDTHGWSNTRSAARKSAKAACHGDIIITEVSLEAQVAASINSHSIEETSVNTGTHKTLEANYFYYLENTNASGGTTLKGKPFTITRTKGSRWYRWNCKGTGTYGWSNSRSHARKTAKAACSGDIIIEEVGIDIEVTASINELTKL